MRETGRDFADVLAEAQARGLRRGRSELRRRRHRRRAQARDADRRRRSAARSISPASMSRASATSPRWTSTSPRSSATASSCSAWRALTEYGIEQRVHPCMVPLAAPIAACRGRVQRRRRRGRFRRQDHVPGPRRGAGADRLGGRRRPRRHRARARTCRPSSCRPTRSPTSQAAPMARHVGAYYIRLMVRDRPGVIADVAAALARRAASRWSR